VFTKTATMSDVGDIFAADNQYHDRCCKSYMNKYHVTIEEIMANIEIEDLVSATNSSLREKIFALDLDFSKSAYSLSYIRDKLNEGSTEILS